MAVDQLFLILISGVGVFHGFLLGIFLWLYKRGNIISNQILGRLLLVLTYRVGKSVVLENENYTVMLLTVKGGGILGLEAMHSILVTRWVKPPGILILTQ